MKGFRRLIYSAFSLIDYFYGVSLELDSRSPHSLSLYWKGPPGCSSEKKITFCVPWKKKTSMGLEQHEKMNK